MGGTDDGAQVENRPSKRRIGIGYQNNTKPNHGYIYARADDKGFFKEVVIRGGAIGVTRTRPLECCSCGSSPSDRCHDINILKSLNLESDYLVVTRSQGRKFRATDSKPIILGL